jgi:hypothetical protein
VSERERERERGGVGTLTSNEAFDEIVRERESERERERDQMHGTPDKKHQSRYREQERLGT